MNRQDMAEVWYDTTYTLQIWGWYIRDRGRPHQKIWWYVLYM